MSDLQKSLLTRKELIESIHESQAMESATTLPPPSTGFLKQYSSLSTLISKAEHGKISTLSLYEEEEL